MCRKLILYFILLSTCFANLINAQKTLTGTVSSPDGLPIEGAVITLTGEKLNSEILQYTLSNKLGKYSLSINILKDSLYLNVGAYPFKSISKIVPPWNDSSSQSIDFILPLMNAVALDEVIVEAKTTPILKRKDTITYNISKFGDGSERKVQDVLGKLPGIDVNMITGEIKYKGKAIQKVLLEGDDLFGTNYTLGTKNINIDILESVEAIERYSENPLLKNIEETDKVALNLKLKKGKMDFSGNLDFESGYFNDFESARKIDGNIVSVSKKYKSFATAQHNNIGINNTPFDYFNFYENLEQNEERGLIAQRIIPETQIAIDLDDEKSNINNQYFLNYNAIFNFTNKFKSKVNLYFLKDNILSEQGLINDYIIRENSFITSDQQSLNRKPQQLRVDMGFDYEVSKKSLLELDTKISTESIYTGKEILQNEMFNFMSDLNTQQDLLKTNLLYTHRTIDENAIQIFMNHSKSLLNQQLVIASSTNQSDEQDLTIDKSIFSTGFRLLGKTNNSNYDLKLGLAVTKTPFFSQLNTVEERNDFTLLSENIFAYGRFTTRLGKLKFNLESSLREFSQQLDLKFNIENVIKKRNLLFQPNLNVDFNISKKSRLSIDGGWKFKDFTESLLYSNNILIDNRTIVNNESSLDVQKVTKIGAVYRLNDIFNQFFFYAQFNRQLLDKGFYPNITIDENSTLVTRTVLNEHTMNTNYELEISKYFDVIKSKIRLISRHSIFRYPNLVNNDLIVRNNKTTRFSNRFFWKTAFEFPINFENVFEIEKSITENANNQLFSNTYMSNNTKLLVRYGDAGFFLSGNYVLPNSSIKNQQFIFLDADFNYRPKKKNWIASITLKNLLNEQSYFSVETTDISRNIFTSNLLPSHVLIGFSLSL